ncbi:DUF3703 domain-containing protein [Pontibacter beigongshangensis]|uniref:DUF3703 domain-containing protein n=1 Tax=Pontibacter beigongshangensis TaxID=2574733 RepID=UPI00164F71A5|nr:DUF3703 domain-containing protein [Pontibacter beigongshangensis]
MKLYWNMPAPLRPWYRQELTAYRTCWKEGNLPAAWRHLERVHILGQPYPLEHTAVHWRMLRFGLKTKNTREAIGQLPRLLVGGVKFWAGMIPVGNTGGANVPPLRPMPIPDDLQQIIRSANNH